MNLNVGRGWAVSALLLWFFAVAALLTLRAIDMSAAVVLLAMAPLISGLVLGYRWHRTLLRRFARLNNRVEKRFELVVRMITDTRRRLDANQQALEALSVAAAERAEIDVQTVQASVAEIVPRVRRAVAGDLMQTYRQLEALLNLHAIAGVDQPLPRSRVWAASPDLLLHLVELVERERPALTVECGSGLSTVWFGLALRRYGIDGRVVALEHQDVYADRTRYWVRLHGVADLVEVRVAGLEKYELGGKTYQWYAEKCWADLNGIDLLFVDGPPLSTGGHARYPALPLLQEKLSAQCTIVLDDMVRKDEQETLASWLETFEGFTEERVRLEKQAAILRRTAPDLESSL